MKVIQTPLGHQSLCSDIDYPYLRRFTWNRHIKGAFYCRSGDLRGRTMHRVVAERMGLDMSKHIDHHNRDKSDNRRCNLRAATNGQNRANSKLNSDNKSGFKGVSLRKRRTITGCRKTYSNRLGDRWVAQINVGGEKLWLGQFGTPEEAHKAYSRAARKYFGRFCNLAKR